MFRYLFLDTKLFFLKTEKWVFWGFWGEESIGDIILSGFFKDYGLSLENDRFFRPNGKENFF